MLLLGEEKLTSMAVNLILNGEIPNGAKPRDIKIRRVTTTCIPWQTADQNFLYRPIPRGEFFSLAKEELNDDEVLGRYLRRLVDRALNAIAYDIDRLLSGNLSVVRQDDAKQTETLRVRGDEDLFYGVSQVESYRTIQSRDVFIHLLVCSGPASVIGN